MRLLTLLLLVAGCYHFEFHQARPAPNQPLVTHQERAATWLNGFVGTGTMDVSRYCANPVSTELRVTGIDVLLSVITILIYTPHTLYVTCAASEDRSLPRAP